MKGVEVGTLFEAEGPISESEISWYTITDSGKVRHQGQALG